MLNHYIKTLKLELTTNSEQNGFQMQQEFSELVRNRLKQKMNDIFDEFGKDQDIRIDNLELEIQGVEAENWEEDFINKFSSQLIAKLKGLQSTSTSSPSSTSPKNLSDWKSFLFFLKNGYFPLFNNKLVHNNLSDFIKKEIESNEAIILLINQVKNDSISLKRLVNHFSISSLDFIFDKCSNNENSFLSFFKILEETFSKMWNKNEIKLEIWTIAFQSLFRNPPERIGKEKFKDQLQLEVIKKSLSYFSSKKMKISGGKKVKETLFDNLKFNFKKSDFNLTESVKVFFQQKNFLPKSFPKKEILPKTQTSSSTSSTSSSSSSTSSSTTNLKTKNHSMEEIFEEGIFIKNAGLVLLNPFLKMLFDRMNLIEDKSFKNESDQYQAALIVQYLATKEFFTMENELVFNKILCNISLANPISTELFLDENQIGICDGLLNAVIQHWTALGNTSTEGLRESFLKREGKLSKKENGDWLLQVESKSIDILLSRLPWSISIIKLPWMENKIMVDWQ